MTNSKRFMARALIVVIAALGMGCSKGTALLAGSDSAVAVGDVSWFPSRDSGLEPDSGLTSTDTLAGDLGPTGALDSGEPCVSGTACDDGDLCTYNDTCEAGTCVGVPVPCDDGLNCTTDACEAGVCVVEVADGACRIDGACWTDGQPNPVNPCQRCLAGVDSLEWSDNDGLICDDGDPCTEAGLCQGGSCLVGPVVCPDDGEPCTLETCLGGICVVEELDEGALCDDGNSCTQGETCQGGQCTAVSSGQCDDGLSCTTDICNPDGSCGAMIVPGFCLIGGQCVNDGQLNVMNPCQRCDASAPALWTSNDGVACGDACSQGVCQNGVCTNQSGPGCPDDGNPCTVAVCDQGVCGQEALFKDNDGDGYQDKLCGGDDCDDEVFAVNTGVGEVCDDGTDNDCDGQTDGEDEDCGGSTTVVPCVYQADCYPDLLCAEWRIVGQAYCSAPCDSPDDCDAGFVCSKLPGSAQVAFCEPALPEGFVEGVVCATNGDCETGICADGKCVLACVNDGGCPPGSVCQLAGGEGTVSGICGLPPIAGLSKGQACDTGQGFGGSACQSAHCDLMPWPAEAWYCDSLCKSRMDCLPWQECNVVAYASAPNSAAVPYMESFQQPFYDAVTACYSASTGTGADGSLCSGPEDCKGHKCFHLLGPDQPNNDQTFCTSFCVHDSDCGAGMKCKVTPMNLTTLWLQSNDFGSQPPLPAALTLVGLCKFE